MALIGLARMPTHPQRAQGDGSLGRRKRSSRSLAFLKDGSAPDPVIARGTHDLPATDQSPSQESLLLIRSRLASFGTLLQLCHATIFVGL
jgi:hypothetical protein